MPVHMMFVAKPHYTLRARKVLFVRMGKLVPFELFLPLEALLANLTAKFPDLVVCLIDVSLQLRRLLECS